MFYYMDLYVYVYIVLMFVSFVFFFFIFFFFKQKTAYEMRISDWSSDVCSSDLLPVPNDSGSLLRRFASPYETRLATDEPMPGTAPMRVPKRLPRIIMPGIFREEIAPRSTPPILIFFRFLLAVG